ncbi:hypothetical protein HT031_001118 [Scenedesmus sp. PABB004]|nr:hypothetical protein HT031_001118 [Scenedesmus sp. PABB004]
MQATGGLGQRPAAAAAPRAQLRGPPAAPRAATAGASEAAAAAPAGEPAAEAAERVQARLASCAACGGRGRQACRECDGRGFLKRGGYNRRNPLQLQRVQGSKWTAMSATLGWRHFRVVAQRKLGPHVFLLLQASCEAGAQLWVNAQALRSRGAWAAGWLPMSEIQGLGLEVAGSRGLKCQACAGLGWKPCGACDGAGRAQLIVL